MGVKLYLNESLILHITEDYEENVKGSGWIKLFSCFTQLTAFCISICLNGTVQSQYFMLKFMAISGNRITHVRQCLIILPYII